MPTDLHLSPSITNYARRKNSLDLLTSWDGSALYAPEFDRIKDDLSRAFADTIDQVINHYPRNETGFVIRDLPVSAYWLQSSTPLLTSLHRSKHIERLAGMAVTTQEKPLHDFLVSTLSTWRPISARLAEMRGAVVKGKRPSAEAERRAAFQALPSTKAAHSLITQRITEITTDWRKSHISTVAGQIRAIHEAFLSGRNSVEETPRAYWLRTKAPKEPRHDPATPWAQFKRELDAYQAAAAHAIELAEITTPCVTDPTYPEIHGTRSADAIIAEYIEKMAAKLGFVAARMTAISATAPRVNAGSLECNLSVCLDATNVHAFTVRSQVVWSTSVLGKHFTRFPATFHHVMTPDHTRRSLASEEEMHGWFASNEPAPLPQTRPTSTTLHR